MLLAIEVSDSKWDLGFSRGDQHVRIRKVEAWDRAAFFIELARARKALGLPKKTEIRSCYEAGRSGFSIHRFLTQNGIDNEVMDSSSIEVARRSKHAKTDRLDLQKMIALMIRKHVIGEYRAFTTVPVPTKEEEDARFIHRDRQRLKKERTGHCARIRSLAALYGIRLAKSLRDLDPAKLRDFSGDPLPVRCLEMLRREIERLELVENQLAELEKCQNKAVKQPKTESQRIAAKLMKLRAVGVQSAWLLSHELFAWRPIANRKQLGALAGLTGVPYSSGTASRDQGISKAGNRRIRWVMVELAWCWLRYQRRSELSLWFNERFGHGSRRQRRIGIVALARKLLIALWKFAQFGEVPAGARLKPA